MTRDVELTLQERLLLEVAGQLAMARTALIGLRRGDCWCEMGIGNPMVRNHSAGCQLAQRVMQSETE